MNTSERLAFQHERFGMALAALQVAVDTDSGDKKSRDSILLSFVFSFEMAWKLLKAALVADGASPPDYAAAVIKAAFTARQLTDADLWVDLREARNDVSHAYDEQRAIAIAELVKARALPALTLLLTSLRPDHG